MPRIHIVTDSGATFSNPRLIKHYPVTILPNQIEIDGVRFQEDIDLESEQAFELLGKLAATPTVIPPSENDYAELYARLSHFYDVIISIHPSRDLSQSWQNGRLAAQQVGNDCEIAVIDSQSLCAGQGMLVRVAARAAHDKLGVEEAIQVVRTAVNRVYSVYCIHNLDYLCFNQIMKPSHAILCAHLGIKPFVSLEDGRIIVIEKVRNQAQAIERLVEFLVEFNELDDAVMLQHQNHISEETRIMQDRLALEFPGQHFPFTMYSTTMATWLGPTAIGVAVLEKETDDLDYDF